MQPNSDDDRRMGTPLVPQRPIVRTPPSDDRQANTQVAAANIVREQLNSIYSGNSATQTPHTTPVADSAALGQSGANTDAAEQSGATNEALNATNPYERTQTNPAKIQQADWKQYHSAWQEYYQKYYERYYVNQVQRTSRALEERAAAATGTRSTQQPQVDIKNETEDTGARGMTREEALYDLRQTLVRKIQDSAKKVRKSNHFFPIAAAACVVVLFLFLQYNRVIFANVEAYIKPGNADPAAIITNPMEDIPVDDDPKLIIPKINVNVPVDYTATPDNASQMKAMNNGVAYFGIPGANSKPGQIGNTPIAGHSSNDIIDAGNYKFIFARLDALTNGDTIYLNYEGKRYVYTVTKKEVVKPSEVGKLVYETDKPILTLITCTPLGTSLNRLLVTAEQVSPSPSDAQPAPSTTGADKQSATIPGNSPTFIERVFGRGN